MKSAGKLVYFYYGQLVIFYGKANVAAGKAYAVDPAGFALVAGPGIVGKHRLGGFPLIFRQLFQQGSGKAYLQQVFPGGVRKAAGGFRLAIGIGDIGLDVEDGRAVHQVSPGYMDHRAILGSFFYPQKPNAGKPQIVGSERGAGSEHAQPGIPPQPGRPYSRGPSASYRFGKLPDDPQMAKALKPPQGIFVAVFRLKDDGRAKLLHQAALPGDAKFGGKIAFHPGDHLNIYVLHISRAPF